MLVIKLARKPQLRNKWGGNKVEDHEMLRRCGAPVYFHDSEYDNILEIVSKFGVTLEIPLGKVR